MVISLTLLLGTACVFLPEKTGPLEIRIDTILSGFPAESSEEQIQLSADIFDLGVNAVKQICLGLEASGQGRDTSLRYALSGMAVYAGRIENEKERRMFVKAVADSLKKHPDKKVKPFLIHMLQLTGKKDAVKPLQLCLQDPELCEPAARALRGIGISAAENALLNALVSSPVSCRATLIKNLGELRSGKAVKEILKYASHSHPDIRKTALFALANSGSPAAEEVLLKSHILASPSERAEAPSLLLLYARRLAENGRTGKSLNITRGLMENFRSPREAHIAAGALTLLVDLQEIKAMEDLLQAAGHVSPELRGQALRLAAGFAGENITKSWIEKAEVSGPAVQAEIITWLGKRADPAAAEYIHEKLNDDDIRIRQAALQAAAASADEHMLPVLIGLVLQASGETLPLISQALLRMPAEPAVSAAAKVFPAAPPEAQASLLQFLAARRSRSHSNLVFSQVKSENETLRTTAFSALEHMVTSSDINRLIDLLFQLKSKPEITRVQKALAAAAGQIPEPENRAAPILKALKKAEGDKRIDFLRPLAETGGRAALQAVLDAYHDHDPKMKAAAVYTLSEWQEFRAADKLLDLVHQAKQQKFRYLALQGFIRLITESELKTDQKAAWMMKVFPSLNHREDARSFLSGLSHIKSREALEMAKTFYSWTGLEKETAWTMVRIILPEPEKEGMRGKDLIPVLKRALNTIQNEHERERILRYMDILQETKAQARRETSAKPKR